VTAASGLKFADTYHYDLDGNRTTAIIGPVTTDYAYDRTDALISRTDGGPPTFLQYDGFGRMTSSAPASNAHTTYAYDYADRLTSATPPGQTATTFTFDAVGRTASRVRPGPVTDIYDYLGTTHTAWRITTGATVVNSALDPSGARLASKTGTTPGFEIEGSHPDASRWCRSAPGQGSRDAPRRGTGRAAGGHRSPRQR
jgi:YD repeat-containing protein